MPSELEEALTAANVGALIAKQIDPLLLEYQRRYSPLVRALPSIKWGSNVYYFNQRTSRVPGGFVSDGGARPVGSSVYAQAQFTIRNLQAVGAVTGFAQEVTRAVIGDLQRREIEGAVQGLLWDIETAICWGNDPATSATGVYPQFSGLDTLASQFVASGSNPQNAIDEAGATLSLGMLDHLVDLVEQNAAAPIMGDEWMFVMSTTANSRIAQLLTNQQRFAGNAPNAEVAPGLNVPTYRDIPIVKSSFLGARGLTMGTVTATGSTGSGTLAAGTYRYQVSPVFARMGEAQASTEVSATLASAGEVALAFAVPSGYDGAAPILYKVFRTSGASGSETLLGYVDAVCGLAGDGVTPTYTATITDNGTTLVPSNGGTTGTAPAAYVGTNTGHLPRGAGDEDIYLISRNADNVVRPYVREVQPVDVYPTTSSPDSLPFALVSDCTLALRAPKYMGRLRNLVATLAN